MNMHQYQEKTDAELVHLALQDKEAFLYLMRRYEKQLLAFIRRISGWNNADAEDILQEAFLKVYLNLNDYDASLRFSSWIYRITRNEVISKWRKLRVRPVVFLDGNEWERFSEELFDKEKIVFEEVKDKVLETFQKMDEKYREVLILKFVEEKDYKEISDILRCPMGTVATLINRAKKQFKKIYSHI